MTKRAHRTLARALPLPPHEQPHTSPSESDLRGASRAEARGGYLAFVAHEMRNPLATALWSAELLARLTPEDRAGPRGEKLAGMCLRTLARLRHLVEDHFLAERLAIQGLPIRLETVPLVEAVTAAAGRVAGVQYDLQDEGTTVVVDRAMFERALEALIAICGRDGATVRISAEVADADVDIVVQGAPPAPGCFSTPDRSTPSDPSGRALGTLMARSVAEAHGGALAAHETGFRLRLPAAARTG